MKLIATLALSVLIGTPALACSIEPASWNLKIMNLISASQEVYKNARQMGGVTSISQDTTRDLYWVSHEGCSFSVKPTYEFPKNRPGQPAACPRITGIEVNAQIDCVHPR